ncbi:MAG TPA: membrane protein insertion efficiency factor YidD [Acidimicrobiales bacterium]|nr:membrane protein insertion efficiency factor YidD [Acidimicrobiales bacterium]
MSASGITMTTYSDSKPAHDSGLGSGARALVRVLRLYQLLRSGRPSPCRFEPSCSQYALESVQVHGAVRGGALALRRLSRCRPLGGRGFDPVPVRGRPR